MAGIGTSVMTPHLEQGKWTLSNELAQRLANHPIAALLILTPSGNPVVSTGGHSTVDGTGRSQSRQHQNRLDDNNAAINNLPTEKNRLHKAYVDRSTDNNGAAFYRSRRLVQRRMCKIQDA
nr:unnamed protein product [Spirometra erinaceieuropaei]